MKRSFHPGSAQVAALAATCALACTDPDLNTELDSGGPPDVTMVNVPSDSLVLVANGAPRSEVPTFCAEQDVRPHFELCDPEARTFDLVSDAQPIGWYVRVVFSELLDRTIEDRIECDTDGDGEPDAMCGSLAQTQPVELSCGGEAVPYDGFYDPSGNDVTFPPGPALVIQPEAYVAAGTSDCEVEVKGMVEDKSGNPVPEDQRGPYEFGVAAMAVSGFSPAAMEEGVDPTAAPRVQFNVLVAVETVADSVTLHDDTNGVDVAVTPEIAVDPRTGAELPNTVALTVDDGMLQPQTDYTITVESGIEDVAGGVLQLDAPVTSSFTTGDVPEMD